LDLLNLESGYHGLVRENETRVEVKPRIRAVGGAVCSFKITNKHHGEAPFEVLLIDREQGLAELRSKKPLNCEKRKNYKFDVVAEGCDGVISESATVHITVKDVNEYAPEFDQPAYVVQVEEGKVYGEITRVTATDQDCSPEHGDVCKYEITTADQPFTIDNEDSHTLTTDSHTPTTPPTSHKTPQRSTPLRSLTSLLMTRLWPPLPTTGGRGKPVAPTTNTTPTMHTTANHTMATVTIKRLSVHCVVIQCLSVSMMS